MIRDIILGEGEIDQQGALILLRIKPVLDLRIAGAGTRGGTVVTSRATHTDHRFQIFIGRTVPRGRQHRLLLVGVSGDLVTPARIHRLSGEDLMGDVPTVRVDTGRAVI